MRESKQKKSLERVSDKCEMKHDFGCFKMKEGPLFIGQRLAQKGNYSKTKL